MTGAIINHLWQSTVFAAAAGLLAFVLRNNRAQVRYWVWFSASMKFVVPFALLMSAGSYWPPAPAAKQIAAAPAAIAMVEMAQPFSEAALAKPSTQSSPDWILVAIFAVWGSGFAVIALMRLLDWRRIHAMVRASSPLAIRAPVEVRSSGGLLEPGVVGVLRPILLLPAGIQDRLTQAQLEAVLAHELCHVRRRDNLFAAVHMVVEAALWFHPLVWWIGARLVEERERACDEEVLRLGNAPDVYAEGILNVCKLYVESPLACVSGVTGSDLKKRIEAIMSHRSALRMNLAMKIIMAVAGMAALAAPVAIGVLRAQPKASATPKWEVASIKYCDSDGGNGRRGGGPPTFSPGRMTLNCQSLEGLITAAYLIYANGANGRANIGAVQNTPITGGPAWIRSDRFTINAKAEGTPGREVMQGPMLQALLEERFKLKIRRETKEVPVYLLTAPKGRSKLQEFIPGSCTPFDVTQIPPAPPPPLAAGQKRCAALGTSHGANYTVNVEGISIEQFSKTYLRSASDRPIIDKTGITGLFNFHLQIDCSLGMCGAVAGPSDDPAFPSVFAAMTQLGLKLEPAKGPGQFLVIDGAERPSEN